MNDPAKKKMLEADLRQFFTINLRDIYDDDSRVSVREICVYVELLPPESRVYKDLMEEPWNVDQHLMATAIDMLVQIHYQTSMSAAGTVGEEAYNIAMEDPPTGIPRPGKRWKESEEKEPEELVFTSPKDAMAALTRRKTKVVHSKDRCTGRGMAEGKCGCPTVDVTAQMAEKDRKRKERQRLAGELEGG